MKELYFSPEIEIDLFETENIITTSDNEVDWPWGDEDTPVVPGR